MSMFYNPNSKYGHPGPHVAASKDELAEEIMPFIRVWAKVEVEDRWNAMTDSERKLSVLTREDDVEHTSFQMRGEFIGQLQEVYMDEPGGAE